MVRRAFEQHPGKGRGQWRLSAALVLVAMVALPVNGWPASSSVGGPHGPSSAVRPWVEDQDYDPAAAYFYSLLSFGAMSVIAPAIFGDFQSPAAVSLTAQWSGIMLQGAGFDAAVSTMLNGVVQQDLLPTAGALIAEEFDIGSSPDSASNAGAAPLSPSGSEFSDNVPTVTGDVSDPTIEAGGIEPICTDDEVADKLQAGGEYWTGSEYRRSQIGAGAISAGSVHEAGHAGKSVGRPRTEWRSVQPRGARSCRRLVPSRSRIVFLKQPARKRPALDRFLDCPRRGACRLDEPRRPVACDLSGEPLAEFATTAKAGPDREVDPAAIRCSTGLISNLCGVFGLAVSFHAGRVFATR